MLVNCTIKDTIYCMGKIYVHFICFLLCSIHSFQHQCFQEGLVIANNINCFCLFCHVLIFWLICFSFIKILAPTQIISKAHVKGSVYWTWSHMPYNLELKTCTDLLFSFIGTRNFRKSLPCNWTSGYRWSTAMLLR